MLVCPVYLCLVRDACGSDRDRNRDGARWSVLLLDHRRPSPAIPAGVEEVPHHPPHQFSQPPRAGPGLPLVDEDEEQVVADVQELVPEYRLRHPEVFLELADLRPLPVSLQLPPRSHPSGGGLQVDPSCSRPCQCRPTPVVGPVVRPCPGRTLPDNHGLQEYINPYPVPIIPVSLCPFGTPDLSGHTSPFTGSSSHSPETLSFRLPP